MEKQGRIIIFTGKGGVGKTSVASAHAVKASDEGLKTILISTDMAHNLSDLFMTPVGQTPKVIKENLTALEINPEYEMNHEFGNLMRALYEMLPAEIGNIQELIMIPGVEELFSLLKVKKIYESGEYDLIIVDCAPTGETLSLLKFPELLSWYMEKFFPLGKMAMKVMHPISKPLFNLQLPDGKAMDDIENLYLQLNDLNLLLKDRTVSSVRIVALPERMVVEETKRNYMYLNLYQFQSDGLFINRVLPEGADAAFFNDWHELQRKYTGELENAFTGVDICKIPWYDTDLNGIDALRRLYKDAFDLPDLFEVRRTVNNEKYEKTEDGYRMELFLPFCDKKDIDLSEGDNELIVKIGNFRRDIMLPSVMRKHHVCGAKMNDSVLSINFTEDKDNG